MWGSAPLSCSAGLLSNAVVSLIRRPCLAGCPCEPRKLCPLHLLCTFKPPALSQEKKKLEEQRQKELNELFAQAIKQPKVPIGTPHAPESMPIWAHCIPCSIAAVAVLALVSYQCKRLSCTSPA